MNAPISLVQLSNASRDADDLGHFVADKEPADIPTRLGGTKPNYAKIVQDINDRADQAIDIIVSFHDRGDWQPNTHYLRKDAVTFEGLAYLTLDEHTSSTSFANDLAAGKWYLYQGISKAELQSSGKDLILYGGESLADVFSLRLNRVVDSISQLRDLNKFLFSRAFVTGYYAPTDGGGGPYQLDPNDATSVDNGGTIIVANDGGRWKLQVIDAISIKQFGAKGDGVDDTSAVVAFFAEIASGRQGYISPGHFICNSLIATPDGTNLNLEFDGAILDFSSAPVTDQGTIIIGTDTGSLTTLPGLAANIAKGDASFTLASAPNLSVGDVYILWDDDDFSWLNIATREYYKAGEFCRVRSVVGNVVTNERRSFDSYATTDNIHVAKLTPNKVNIWGNGKLIFPSATTNSGIVLWNGYRSTIQGLELSGAKRSHIDFRRCYESRVIACNISDLNADVGLNYGVSMIGCCDSHVSESSIHTTRHGVTLTGGSIAASIPNRLCTVHDSTLTSDFLALDMHGSVEHCSFIDNQVYGGIDIAGDHSVVKGCKIFTSYNAIGQVGVGIRVREILGANHTISNVNIIVMDAVIGGSDAPIALNLADQYSPTTGLRGGELRLSDVVIEANVALSIGVRISIPAASQGNVKLSVDGVTATRPSGTMSPVFRVAAAAGGFFDKVLINHLDGIAPSLVTFAARLAKLSEIEISESPNPGIQMTLVSAAVPQRVEVLNCSVNLAQTAGILMGGPNTTDDITVLVQDCLVLDSNEAGAATISRYKVAVAFENVPRAMLKDNTIGDTRAVQKQNHAYSATNVGVLTEFNNEQLGAALVSDKTSVGSTITSLPTI